MTYNEFVKMFCENHNPTETQRQFIESFLDLHDGTGRRLSTLFFVLGARQSGRSMVRRWLINYLLWDEQRERLHNETPAIIDGADCS